MSTHLCVLLGNGGRLMLLALALAATQCQGFKNYLANPTGLPPSPPSPGEQGMVRDYKRDDGYKAVDMDELGPEVRGQRVKTCGQLALLGNAPSDQTDVEGVNQAKAQQRIPSDRFYLVAPTVMGKRVFVSVPGADEKAIWGDLAGQGRVCMWFDGEVQDLDAPDKVRKFQKWSHLPAVRWDGPSKPHAPETVPASGGSSSPSPTP